LWIDWLPVMLKGLWGWSKGVQWQWSNLIMWPCLCLRAIFVSYS